MKTKKISEFFRLIARKLEGKIALQAVLVWLLFFGLYSIISFTVDGVSFTDDQWFHFKYAYLLRTRGAEVVHHFPWLHFTNLVKYDRQYAVTLFHFFLVPFTFIPNMVLGMKLADVSMAAVVFAVFFYVLKRFEVRWPIVWTILLFVFSTSPFTTRVLLGRNLVFISAFAMLEFFFLIKGKYIQFFLVALVHTWWHPATFWFAPLIAGIVESMRYINQKKIKYEAVVIGTIGSLLGFLLFPANSDNLYAPMNPIAWVKNFFSFFYGIDNGAGIKEGVEVYKEGFMTFAGSNRLLVLAIIFITVFSVWIYIAKKRGKADPEEDREVAFSRDSAFLIIIVLFLGMIEVSFRFQDFLVPFIFLSLALIHKSVFKNGWTSVADGIFKKAAIFSLILWVLLFAVNKALNIRNGFHPESDSIGYAEAGNWLKDNTSEGTLVFNTDWGQFTRLFFYDSQNNYIVGIEPKNLYYYKPEMYWLWHNIVYNGLYCNRQEDCASDINKNFNDINTMGPETRQEMAQAASLVAPIIKNTFQSRYIFFGNNTLLRRELAEDKNDFELKYSDKNHNIYIYYVK